METIYRYSVQLLNGETIALKQFKGKPVLIVNIASKCSFAAQLSALEKIYKQYRSNGFEIIAFPCNQFGRNEPLENAMLKEFYNGHFDLTFKIGSKIQVNGPDAHPLFNYLKSNTRGISQNRVIKWNFTKFLVNSEGVLVSRYAPRTKPETLKPIIESHLNIEDNPIQLAKL